MSLYNLVFNGEFDPHPHHYSPTPKNYEKKLMKFFKKLLDFYIHSSLHVALACASFLVLTFLEYEIKNASEYIGFAFFGTIVGYNFIKYNPISNLYHRQQTRFLKTILILTVFASVITIYYLIKLSSIELVLVLLPFILLTVFYAIPLQKGSKNLRRIAGFKIVFIAFVWTGITVIIPLVYYDNLLFYDLIMESIQRFIFVLVLMLPFEIRDLPYDAKELKTMPQVVGIQNTKRIGTALLFIFTGLSFWQNISILEMFPMIFTVSGVLILLWKATPKQSKYYSSLWVESIPVFWLVLTCVIK